MKKTKTEIEKDVLQVDDMYKHYAVGLTFVDKFLGGVPKDPEIIRAWLNSEATRKKLERKGLTVADVLPEVMTATEVLSDQEEAAWSGFRKDAEGIYIAAHQIPAMLHDAANLLQLHKEVQGLKNTLTRGVYVRPDHVHFKDKPMPDGSEEWGARVQGIRGPRSILQKHDYVENAEVEFTVSVIDNGKLSEKNLRRMFYVSQEMGMGAARPRGYGKFKVTEFGETDEK